ncbi:hypothetical protein ACSX1A_08465 [Pontibacter sp. MBLB2868]|uniref:hypothetical protein n=1 Tax=Pontibacter sp. MBLB2868 TaxID=3451555 RepID=UPI003F74C3BC
MRKLLLFALLPLLGCKHTPENPVDDSPTDHAVAEEPTDTPTNLKDTTYVAYQVDTTELSPAPQEPVHLLVEGTFHKNEVWRGADKENWLGLFYEDNQYILRPASLQVIPVFDPIHDAHSLNSPHRVISGREVVGDAPNALFYVSGILNLKKGPVDTAAFNKAVLPANKELVYTFKEKKYLIQAFGDSIKLPSKEYSYQNYGWRVSGKKNGVRVNQVLAEDEFFEDSIYVLLWAGDLDHDNIPDLLLDMSNHFNVSKIGLFLSSGAGKGKLYKKPVVLETVGS